MATMCQPISKIPTEWKTYTQSLVAMKVQLCNISNPAVFSHTPTF